jgi:hypothetical protein
LFRNDGTTLKKPKSFEALAGGTSLSIRRLQASRPAREHELPPFLRIATSRGRCFPALPRSIHMGCGLRTFAGPRLHLACPSSSRHQERLASLRTLLDRGVFPSGTVRRAGKSRGAGPASIEMRIHVSPFVPRIVPGTTRKHRGPFRHCLAARRRAPARPTWTTLPDSGV